MICVENLNQSTLAWCWRWRVIAHQVRVKQERENLWRQRRDPVWRMHGINTVEVEVKMDCEGCERKVKKSVEGVTEVEVDRQGSKVSVSGYVEPSKVVSRIAHRTGLT
ncbi:Heavy metal-associated isoprenylated plant protein 27 [Glycine soja]|uniref:Heavy metal-associated isoprenylated plant protein 27 n=1 Tax=Glycine soja TaxID=3848 RepID=A0A445HK58_GLYSO|nr:Heavy metal-associated isoprenylated plant protein 27 [Glycine soja]